MPSWKRRECCRQRARWGRSNELLRLELHATRTARGAEENRPLARAAIAVYHDAQRSVDSRSRATSRDAGGKERRLRPRAHFPSMTAHPSPYALECAIAWAEGWLTHQPHFHHLAVLLAAVRQRGPTAEDCKRAAEILEDHVRNCDTGDDELYDREVLALADRLEAAAPTESHASQDAGNPAESAPRKPA